MLNVPPPTPRKTHPGPEFWRGMVYALVLTFSVGVVVWALFL